MKAHWTSLLAIAQLLLSLPHLARAEGGSCALLDSWITAADYAASTPARNHKERTRRESLEWEARKQATGEIFDAYLASRWDLSRLEPCLADRPEKSRFLNSLYSEFFDRSIAQLRKGAGPQTHALLKLLDRRASDGNLSLFRLTGHFQAESPTEQKGGFHRGSGSIYMDLGRVPHGEWLILLVHELLHSLDDQLAVASREYSSDTRAKLLVDLAKRTDRPAELAPGERSELDAWIEAGLGRGLWAEYRAWWATRAIYLEGLRLGRLSHVDWLDSAMHPELSGLAAKRALYDSISARSSRPSEGLFKRPLIQAALDEVLEAHATGGKLPPLGGFAVFK